MWSWMRRLVGNRLMGNRPSGNRSSGNQGQRGASDAPNEPAPPPSPAGDLLPELKRLFEGSDDVKFHDLLLGDNGPRAVVIFIEGFVDGARLENFTLRPLLLWAQREQWRLESRDRASAPRIDLDVIRERIVPAAAVNKVYDVEAAAAAVLSGDTLLLLDGVPGALHIANRGPQARGVEDPILEVTVRGPRDSFTETLLWNTALIRRRLKDPRLRVEFKKVGRRSRTDVAVLHIDGIAPQDLVDEVRRRLDAIDIDAILDTGYIEQLVEDAWLSPFPQHLKTERPDKVAAGLLIGRIALLADTTPFALILPATFDSFFHSPEDSYDRFLPVNFLRVIRLVAATLSTVIPALYVALVAYHPGTLPTELALKIQASREGVAFPVLVEALIMQFFLELIREAGLRLPGPLGQTFGIVGGLILGDVGIRAGIVSEAMVITVAATAISSFASVDRELGTALRLLGFPIMLSTALLGLYGFIMGALAVLIHLSILRSYGIPYLAPYPYYQWSSAKDAVTKAPQRLFRRRPAYLAATDMQRQQPLHTDPEEGGDGPQQSGAKRRHSR